MNYIFKLNVIVGFSFLLISCGSPSLEEIKEIDTVAAYDDFLDDNEETELKLEILKLREDAFARESKSKADMDSYNSYIKEYPDGQYTQEFKLLIEMMSYQKARFEDSLESYENYLKEFPNSKYSQKVHSLKQDLKRIADLQQGLDNTSSEQEKIQLKDKIEQIFWDRTDQFSTESLIVFMNKKVKKEALSDYHKKAEYQLEKLLASYKRLLEKPILEIDKVTNIQNKEVEFLLPAKLNAFVYMTGEKAGDSVAEQVKGSKWLDYGGIKDEINNIELLTLSSGFPSGGLISNMVMGEFLSLKPGTYNLHYKTDKHVSWGDWKGEPPLYKHWGISVSFTNTGKVLLNEIKKAIAMDPEDKYLDQLEEMETIAEDLAEKTENDKQEVFSKLGKRFVNFNVVDDIEKLSGFIADNPDNFWLATLKYALVYKRYNRALQDISFTQVEITDKPIQSGETSWFMKSAEADGSYGKYSSFEEMQQDPRSREKAFVSVKGKDLYFSGLVENKSQETLYNLNVIADFEINQKTCVKVWLVRNCTNKKRYKSAHFKVPKIDAGDVRPFVFVMGSGSASQINVGGLMGGGSKSNVSGWTLDFTVSDNENYISTDEVEKQKKLLAKSGLKDIDIDKDSINTKPLRKVDLSQIPTLSNKVKLLL